MNSKQRDIPAPCSSAAWEVQTVCEMIDRQDPRDVYLEIGSNIGGSLWAFGRHMTKCATLIAVEKPGARGRDPGGALEQLQGVADRLEAGCGYQPRIVLGDSHAAETLASVTEMLAGRKIDVLFIDGDHSLAGVTGDAERYLPLVRSGGLVIFHDCGLPTSGMKSRVIRQLTACRSVWAKYAADRRNMLIQEWCGYGMVWNGVPAGRKDGQDER